MGYQKSNNRFALAVSESNGVISVTTATSATSETEPFEFELGGAAGAWTIHDALTDGYLYAVGGGNYLRTQTTNNVNGEWTITVGEDGAAVPVSNAAVEQNIMRFNLNASNGTPLFSCYKSSSTIIAPVYFFKAGGAPVIDPEPSNYPTNFSAAVNMLDAKLTWTDATGTQLPARYLVIGSTGNIEVPVDGTPVANGALAANVTYGTQAVTFSGLEPNTTYHFAIFPYTNSGANIDYKTDGSYPTATVTTADVFVLLNENFDEGLGVFTAFDVYGDQGWSQNSYNGKTYASMNGYANSMANANEDWLISPALAGTYANINLQFSSAMKFDGNPLRLMISTDYDGISEPSEFTWQDITDMFDWSTGNYEWVESGVGNIESYAGTVFHLAFVYTSTTEAASAWEIDFVKAIADTPLSVENTECQSVNVFPNPSSNTISFNLTQDAQVAIYDMNGRMVMENSMKAGLNRMDIANIDNGVYCITFRYADGTSHVARIVRF